VIFVLWYNDGESKADALKKQNHYYSYDFSFRAFFLSGDFSFFSRADSFAIPLPPPGLFLADGQGLMPLQPKGLPAPSAISFLAAGKIIDWGLKVMTYAAIAVIVAMASSISSYRQRGHDDDRQGWHHGLSRRFRGDARRLLIINTVLNIMVVNDTDSENPLFGLRRNGTFSFTCDTSSSAGSVRVRGLPRVRVGEA